MKVDEAAKNGGCNGSGCHTGVTDANYASLSNAARGLTTGNGYDGNPATQTLKTELQSFATKLGAAISAKAESRSTIRPCCINATVCSAGPSPRCWQTRLNTSSRQIDGSTSSSVASIAAAKYPAFGPSARYSSHAEESTVQRYINLP
jgi:hypothetical protein